MKVYFWQQDGHYSSITENGYWLFGIHEAGRGVSKKLFYEIRRELIEVREIDDTEFETAQVVRVRKPESHHKLAATILHSYAMGYPSVSGFKIITGVTVETDE